MNACIGKQQRMLSRTQPPGALQQPTIPGQKFEHTHTDVREPFILTISGTKFVIVAVDAVSKIFF